MASILLIEDDAPVRRIISMMLEKEGHEVSEAADGELGIQIYRERSIDLVITDIIMPNKEGLEMIKELKKEYPDVKIIAISGGGKIEGRHYLKLAKKFGVDLTFEKPFNWQKLIESVNEIIGHTD